MGLLATVALPRFSEFRAAAYDARAQQDLRNLAAAQELYRATAGSYASTASQLSAFRASQGVELSIEGADEDGFMARAGHPSGNRGYTWDSDRDPPLASQLLNPAGG